MSARSTAVRIAQQRATVEKVAYVVWCAIRDSKIVYAVLPKGERPRTHIASQVVTVDATGEIVPA